MSGDSPAESEKPGEFLQKLSAALASQPGVDADLAKILADHVLQDAQSVNSVASARQAIADLAIARAKADS
jgi:hypothetical protein